MEIVVVSLCAFAAALLTLFSGFGLGTLLMPVMALFFPIDIAIAMTAMVHFSNNMFKGFLVGKEVERRVLLIFGIPAMLFAFLGAFVLISFSALPPLFEYSWWGKEIEVLPLKFIIGIVILGFVALELSPKIAKIQFEPKYLPFGGALSGFFGGLSGNQGAFRSMFLLKAGLSKEQFIATGVMLAIMVDMARMLVYGVDISISENSDLWVIFYASLAAFLGSYVAAKLIKKVTIESVKRIVSLFLIVISLGMIVGLV
ncbi:MAG TPA: hypothetical protein CFH83_01330 [Sulfuricurvum kujiense]|uniref:Probable membrane transporter protein n=1 Tax=Sulfuricurvum kujiense TaxID=148813 RepID=A0A2D3WRG2_9BACT|nr:sulfite exporter TauE/SafE family protein [Sulfuricurvum kujiense]DAB39313.1 MAG TPA: hypothetical protein CFH83_01330 [Sulfuricurvum kujiense]